MISVNNFKDTLQVLMANFSKPDTRLSLKVSLLIQATS